MYALEHIKELHIELTERCNAGCPMCGRYQASGGLNVNLHDHELNLAAVRESLPHSFLSQLERVRMCGNFGDPAVAKDALAITEFFRMSHPAIRLSFHTNGGVRDAEWWYALGRLFASPGDELCFALDGLSDTLGLYRKGVSFERVCVHADAAIRAGARAHWVMLAFQHNEHQIDEARELSRRMGFASFRLKATKRFFRGDSPKLDWVWPVQGRSGETLYTISGPNSRELRNSALVSLESSGSNSGQSASIACHAAARKSLYISASGHVFPCCWTAASLFPADRQGPTGSFAELLNGEGGLDALSLSRHSLATIVENRLFQSRLATSWRDGGPAICARTCDASFPSFTAQFIEHTHFRSQAG